MMIVFHVADWDMEEFCLGFLLGEVEVQPFLGNEMLLVGESTCNVKVIDFTHHYPLLGNWKSTIVLPGVMLPTLFTNHITPPLYFNHPPTLHYPIEVMNGKHKPLVLLGVLHYLLS